MLDCDSTVANLILFHNSTGTQNLISLRASSLVVLSGCLVCVVIRYDRTIYGLGKSNQKLNGHMEKI